MSKKKTVKSSSGRVLIALGVIIALAAVGIAALALNGGQQTEASQQAAAVQRIGPEAYQAQFAETERAHLLLDVRTPGEFAEGYIPGAVNISLQTLAQRLDEVPQDQPVVIYCRSGNRSAEAAEILRAAGYSEVYDLGGIIDWATQGYPVQ
jgi:phage shock protein E